MMQCVLNSALVQSLSCEHARAALTAVQQQFYTLGIKQGEIQIWVANKTSRSTWKHGFKNVIISD